MFIFKRNYGNCEQSGFIKTPSKSFPKVYFDYFSSFFVIFHQAAPFCGKNCSFRIESSSKSPRLPLSSRLPFQLEKGLSKQQLECRYFLRSEPWQFLRTVAGDEFEFKTLEAKEALKQLHTCAVVVVQLADGRAVASNTRGHMFESIPQQFCKKHFLCFCI